MASPRSPPVLFDGPLLLAHWATSASRKWCLRTQVALGIWVFGGFSALRFWVSLDVRLPGNHNSHRHDKKQGLYSSALPNHEF